MIRLVNMVAPKRSKEYAYAKEHGIPVVTSEKPALEAKNASSAQRR